MKSVSTKEVMEAGVLCGDDSKGRAGRMVDRREGGSEGIRMNKAMAVLCYFKHFE